MEFVKALIKPSYWFTHQHPVPDQWALGLALFFGTIVLWGLVTLIMGHLKKRFATPVRSLLLKFSVWGWVMGLLGFVLLFCSIQQIWLVSARGFYLVWLV